MASDEPVIPGSVATLAACSSELSFSMWERMARLA